MLSPDVPVDRLCVLSPHLAVRTLKPRNVSTLKPVVSVHPAVGKEPSQAPRAIKFWYFSVVLFVRPPIGVPCK